MFEARPRGITARVVTLALGLLLAVSVALPVRAQSVSENLRVHLAMDEGEGSAIFSSTATAARGAVQAGQWTAGRMGKGLKLDGKESWIGFTSFDFGETFTLALWCKPTHTQSPVALIANSSTAANATGFVLDITPDGSLRFTTGNCLDLRTLSTKPGLIQFDQWNHVAVAVNVNRSSASLFHNGVMVESDGRILGDFMQTAPWTLGATTDQKHRFAGELDDVRIYGDVMPGLVLRALSTMGGNAANEAELAQAAPAGPVSFVTHIKPILEKQCISCHGAEKQKGDLRLDSRRAALKGGKEGPAIVPGKPDQSLMLKLVMLPESDPDRMPAKGPALSKTEVDAIKTWIEKGALWPDGVKLVVGGDKTSPAAPVAKRAPSSADIVKFEGVTTYQPSKNPTTRRIDELVLIGHQQKKITPAQVAPDDIFMRRAYLDITGSVPTYAQAKAFLADPSPDKREKLIDQLLESPGYVAHMYTFWAELLRLRSDRWDEGDRYAQWLRASIQENKPYDKMVYELLTASGNPAENGAVGFFFRDRDTPLTNISMLSQVFLGTQIGCAQCHNHKFDKWTQKQFYETAAFFANVELRHDENTTIAVKNLMDKRGMTYENPDAPVRWIYESLYQVNENPQKKLRLPPDYAYDNGKPGDVVSPAIIFDARDAKSFKLKPGETPRQGFARWLTAKDNEQFARVMANRLWKKAMGLGIVEPVDDWKADTQPSNILLMRFLEAEFARTYDIKKFQAAIYKSKAYQLAANGDSDLSRDNYVAQATLLRRMSAEQIWDSLLTLMVDDPDQYKRSPSEATRYVWSFQAGNRSPELAVELIERYRKGDRSFYASAGEAMMGSTPAMSDTMMSSNMTGTKTPAAGSAPAKANRPTAGAPKPELAKAGSAKPDAMKPDMMNKGSKPSDSMMSMMGDSSAGTKQARRIGPYVLTRANESLYPEDAGSLLRMFGQSSREALHMESTDADVQQVLFLLNGNLTQHLLSKETTLSRNLAQASTAAEKVQVLFLSTISRQPTPTELGLAAQEIETNHYDGVANVLRALLNSREFLFIQ